MNTDERIDAIAKQLDELTGITLANEERRAAADEQHEREIAEIRATIRQAVLLSVREARAEREKRRELAARVEDLAATVRRLADIRHTNGNPPTEP